MFLLAKQMKRIYSNKKEEDLYINNTKKMDLVSIAKYVEIDKEQTNPKSVQSTYTCLRSMI